MRNPILKMFCLTAFVAWTSAAPEPSLAQQRVVRQAGPMDGRLLLPGTMYLFKNDKEAGEFSVSNRMDFGQEPDPRYKDFDLKQGDVIMMVDGIPVSSAADFSKHYDEVEVGSEIALGIRREGEPMVAVFTKPDPSELPQMRTMTTSGGSGAIATTGGKVEVKDGKYYVDGKEVKPGEGVVIKKAEPKKEKPKPPPGA